MELSAADLIWLIQSAGYELMLFASVGILLIGLDDLLFDSLWLASGVSRRKADRLSEANAPEIPGCIAIFLPAWDEAEVLAHTILTALGRWRGEDIRLYIGCYPNDAATLFAVSPLVRRDPRLRLVIGRNPGPTTKADNLNNLWRAMVEDEQQEGRRFAAVVLHDAEDIVHTEEIRLYRRYLIDHAMVQIPVVPIVGPAGQWIGGHYADEFAEAHGKELPLRSYFGLPMPSAGVGCALSRNSLGLLALERGENPFRPASLTEDYEIGLMLGARGLATIFVDACDPYGQRIVSQGAFPDRPDQAWRQKGRWIAGIALAGWDYLGWAAGVREAGRPRWKSLLATWMLWRDRRAPLAAVIMLAAYAGLCLATVDILGHWLAGWPAPVVGDGMRLLLGFNLTLLLWRLGVRCHFTWRTYGGQQAWRAIPRAFVSNIIAIAASARAVRIYCRSLQTNRIVWDKTAHRGGANGEEMLVRTRVP